MLTTTKSLLASVAILATLLVGGATLAAAQEPTDDATTQSETPESEAPAEPDADADADADAEEESPGRSREDCPEKDNTDDEATESST